MPFSALNRPVRTEASLQDLEVAGTIPEDIQGAFAAAVPDPAHGPMFDDDITLSAAGMVALPVSKAGMLFQFDDRQSPPMRGIPAFMWM